MSNEHRERAVEAVEEALQRDTALLDEAGDAIEDFDFITGVALHAAEPHLQRMFLERYRETLEETRKELLPLVEDALARRDAVKGRSPHELKRRGFQDGRAAGLQEAARVLLAALDKLEADDGQ